MTNDPLNTVPQHPFTLAGGPWAMELTPWDFWCQTSDPAMDGDPGSGNNALNDCGPESVSMCVAHLTNVVLDADYIKDCIKGAGYTGYTSLADLQLFLKKFVRTDSLTVFAQTKNEWLWHIWKSLTLGHPLIGLFSFSGPGAADGHFRPIIGMSSDQHIVTADPWNAGRRVQTFDELWSWAKGPLIRIHRKRSILV